MEPVKIVNQNQLTEVENVSVVRDKNDEAIKKDTAALEIAEQSNQKVEDMFQKSLDGKWGFVERVKNRGMFKTVNELKHSLIRESGEARIKFYKTVLETRMEILREKSTATIKMLKAHHREQVSSFLMSKMEELTLKVKNAEESFLVIIEQKHLTADGITRASTKERYMKSILNEEDRHFTFLERLLINFQEVLDAEIHKYD